MSQQVATAENPFSSARRRKTAKRNPKMELFSVILFSCLGGQSLNAAFHEFIASSGNHWVSNFVTAAACLVFATTMGIPLIRADKAKPPAADAESILRITAE